MVKRRWRFYTTAAGREPVRAFLDELTDVDAAAVVAAMQEAAIVGLGAGRHLRGDTYELRVDGDKQGPTGWCSQPNGARAKVLPAMEAFSKETHKTPAARSTWRRDGLPTRDPRNPPLTCQQ